MADTLSDLIQPISLNWRSTNGILVTAVAAATGVYLVNRLLTPEDKEAAKFKRLAKLPMPPGAVPILGHLPYVGSSPHLAFSKWGQTLGPIFAVKMGSGRLWVVHNSVETVRELMDRRGSAYSDRVHTDIMDALTLNGTQFGGASYGPYLKQWRKLTNNSLSKLKLEKNHPEVFNDESRYLLLSILESGNPDINGYDPRDNVYEYTVNFISRIIFHKRFTKDDPDWKTLFELSIDVVKVVSNLTIELFPFLKPFHYGKIKFAESVQIRIQQLFGRFVEEIRQARKEGKEIPCACNEYLKAQEVDNDEGHVFDLAIINSCAGLILAGVDTSVAVLLSLFTVLVNYPDIQDYAYAELNEKIGLDRLPEDKDEEHVPYIHAIIVEILRFRPPLWLGFPHSNSNDEEYNGYHIPANSGHVINAHRLHFDPQVYPDPYSFKPERHLDSGNTRQHFSFGAGRRVCPGSFLAEKSLFTTVSRILWAFRIEHALDAQGKRIEVPVMDEKFDLSIMPRYRVRFVPRHDNVLKLAKFD